MQCRDSIPSKHVEAMSTPRSYSDNDLRPLPHENNLEVLCEAIESTIQPLPRHGTQTQLPMRGTDTSGVLHDDPVLTSHELSNRIRAYEVQGSVETVPTPDGDSDQDETFPICSLVTQAQDHTHTLNSQEHDQQPISRRKPMQCHNHRRTPATTRCPSSTGTTLRSSATRAKQGRTWLTLCNVLPPQHRANSLFALRHVNHALQILFRSTLMYCSCSSASPPYLNLNADNIPFEPSSLTTHLAFMIPSEHVHTSLHVLGYAVLPGFFRDALTRPNTENTQALNTERRETTNMPTSAEKLIDSVADTSAFNIADKTRSRAYYRGNPACNVIPPSGIQVEHARSTSYTPQHLETTACEVVEAKLLLDLYLAVLLDKLGFAYSCIPEGFQNKSDRPLSCLHMENTDGKLLHLGDPSTGPSSYPFANCISRISFQEASSDAFLGYFFTAAGRKGFHIKVWETRVQQLPDNSSTTTVPINKYPTRVWVPHYSFFIAHRDVFIPGNGKKSLSQGIQVEYRPSLYNIMYYGYLYER